MTIPIMVGRPIEEGDNTNTPRVAVINETLARKYFGSSSPIGRRFAFGNGNTSPYIEIVGVAADTKYSNLRNEVPPTAYLPAFQDSNLGFIRFEVRTAGDPRDIISAVRHAVQSLDKDLPISDVKTQVEQIDQTLFQERLFAKLSSFFGLLALILACIGIYGIM
jgi:ABC-type antimicrobial peptide transport system permease subunit